MDNVNFYQVDPESFHFGELQHIITFIEAHQTAIAIHDQSNAILHTADLLKALRKTKENGYELHKVPV